MCVCTQQTTHVCTPPCEESALTLVRLDGTLSSKGDDPCREANNKGGEEDWVPEDGPKVEPVVEHYSMMFMCSAGGRREACLRWMFVSFVLFCLERGAGGGERVALMVFGCWRLVLSKCKVVAMSK